ncbi:hypothetical protein H2198_008334 [Neophaeococcomyces mojaviensis]|uniref:Uncharacterized protein n=1 Tax=Neophaeococcomyces mojaviensis TaxID=3383035 RepID=A0ACC2ZXG6_9EURO|nr:hypothetical protein H2198_008334 [Knufia sp. JES_112]
MANAFSTASSDNSVAYINGRVYTINDQVPWAEAFIVGPDGTFCAVGTTGEIETKARQQHLTTYDLRGQFVMPGIHDAHVHLLISAIAITSQARLPIQLTNTNVAEELKKGSCLCKYTHVNQDWFVANGYSVDDFHRSSLDAAFPDTPVMIRGGAGHSAFLNTTALKRAGYSIDSEPDGQGTCYKRDSSGHLTGEMAEMSMSKLLTSLPKPSPAHIKRVLKEAQFILHRAGVTSVQEASSNTLLLQALQNLDAEGVLKLETHTHITYAPDWIGEEPSAVLHALIDQAEAYKSKHVDTRFVKIILDGVPLEPYYTHAGLTSDGKCDSSKLFITNVHEAVQKYDARGMTMKIHCTGHGATRLTLDAFEAARKANPNGPRHEIAHCSGVHDDDYSRFKELNVTAEMSPAFFFVHPVTEASNGLMDWNFPKMLAASAHITIGSDWGAGEAPDLLPCLGAIAEKVGNGDRVLGGQKICRMLTLSGAEAMGREKELGSIEVGKKANFIAVDKDLSQGEFDDAHVLTTWFEGEIVYEKP